MLFLSGPCMKQSVLGVFEVLIWKWVVAFYCQKGETHPTHHTETPRFSISHLLLRLTSLSCTPTPFEMESE